MPNLYSDNGHRPSPNGQPDARRADPVHLHHFKYRDGESDPYYCHVCQGRWASVMLAWHDPCPGGVVV